MRAEPPSQGRRRGASRPAPPPGVGANRRVRCPYLEQLLKERAGPFGMLTRYKADCHVDRRTHRFTGRNPVPPCISDPPSCAFYQRAHADEDRSINRYTD